MRTIGPVLLAMLQVACGCSQDGTVADAAWPTSVCVSDWVVPASEPTLAPSLPVDAPRLLWSVDLPGYPSYGGTGPVLSGQRLVVTTSSHLVFVGKNGSTIAEVPGRWSAPVADSEGNVYLVTATGISSLTGDGQKRWQVAAGGSTCVSSGGEFPTWIQYPPAVLSTDGVLFAVTSDQKVHAVDSRSGLELWSAPAPFDPCWLSEVKGGGGNRLMLLRTAAPAEFQVLDVTTGATIGPLRKYCTGGTVGSFGWTMAVECTTGATIFDTCHVLPAPDGTVRTLDSFYADLVAPGERLVMFDFSRNEDHGTREGNSSVADRSYLTLYNRDGSIAAGPVRAEGRPWVVGADGIIYTIDYTTNSYLVGVALRIVAYSPELKERWRFDQPVQFSGQIFGVVLDEDGVLYLTQPAEAGTNLTAIQTGSPGLASSSWPAPAHDNRGTAWLGQLVRAVLPMDGGIDASPSSLDAGDDLP